MIWWRIFFIAGWGAHWRCFKELLTVLVISTSPLTLGAFLHRYIDAGSHGYWSSLGTIVQRGELFLYSMSVVSTILWLANKEWISEIWPRQEQRHDPGSDADQRSTRAAATVSLLPPKWFFNLYSALALAICTMFFGIETVRFRIESSSLIVISALIYVVSVVLWYIINVLSSVDPPNIERSLDAGARSMADRLRNLRSGDGS